MRRNEKGSPVQEPPQERVAPTLNPWEETGKVESNAREVVAKAFTSEKPEQVELCKQKIIDTIITWRSREDNYFDQELERMICDVLDKYIANKKVLSPDALMYRLGLIAARGQVMLNTKVLPPSVETTFQEEPDKKAVLEQAVNNFISATKFEDELQSTTDQKKLQSLYSRLLEHNLSDHIVDQLMHQIKRSNVMPTPEQSQLVLRWLEQKTQEPEQKLRSDADRMGYAEYQAKDNNHGELARKVYQYQLDTFSNLTGIKATAEGRAEERKRFSEWKKEGQEDTLNHIMDDLLEEWSSGVDTDYKITKIYKILSSPEQYTNILQSDKDLEYLKTLVPFLEQIKDLEEQMKKDLANTRLVSKDSREKIFKDANGQIAKVYRRMKTAINSINADRNNWLKKQLEQGNLRVWSEGEIMKLKARSPQETGEMSDLGRAAIDKAVKERNAELYGLTDEERALEGQEWQEMVKEKRSHATKQIEAKLLAMVGLRKKEKFSNMFKGLFQGDNELSLEKGKKAENKEFLQDIFADKSFIDQLVFSLPEGFNRNESLPEKNHLGRIVLAELVELAKELLPNEGETLAANGLDTVLLEQQGLESKISNLVIDQPTQHFDAYFLATRSLGINTPFDELDSVRGANEEETKQNLKNVDILKLLEYRETLIETILPNFVRVYLKHFGKEETKQRFLADIFEGPRNDDYKSEIRDSWGIGHSPSMKKNLVKNFTTILMEEGVVDFSELRGYLRGQEAQLEQKPAEERDTRLEERVTVNKEVIYATPDCGRIVDHGLALQKIAQQQGVSVEELLAKLAA